MTVAADLAGNKQTCGRLRGGGAGRIRRVDRGLLAGGICSRAGRRTAGGHVAVAPAPTALWQRPTEPLRAQRLSCSLFKEILVL